MSTTTEPAAGSNPETTILEKDVASDNPEGTAPGEGSSPPNVIQENIAESETPAPEISPESTPVEKIEDESEPKINSSENDEETSAHNKKALEFLAAAEGNEEETEEKELDVKGLSKNIINILNEGRSDGELNKDQLLEKSEDLQAFISKLVQVLAEKTELCVRLDRQNNALINQAKTLKNVVGITKDLLGLRNMEVEHLHEDLKVMEESIAAERARHDLILKKLSEAMSLNEQLKNEYHTQSGLFQSLREKYHEKIILLTKENERLQNLIGEEKEEIPQENGEVNNSTEVVEK